MPIEPILREWPTEMKTLRDMVLWLNWVREHQTTDHGRVGSSSESPRT